MYSIAPPQAALFPRPVLPSLKTLLMLSAAVHWVALLPVIQPGG